MYIHIGYTLSPKKEVGVGEEESSGIGEVEVVVREMYTGHAPVYISRTRYRYCSIFWLLSLNNDTICYSFKIHSFR